MGNDPTYVVGSSFNKFPFPALEESPLKQRIRDLGERLDAHRKKQQALHPDLTLTGLYNVLEVVRAGTPLNAKEKAIHDKGLVSILQQIHDELDEAVLEAYGWSDFQKEKERGTGVSPVSAPEIHRRDACAPFEEELLTRLVALNHARAAEEKKGLIRWLRPDYQNPSKSSDGHRPPLQGELDGTETPKATKAGKPAAALVWPASLSAQVTAVQKLIPTYGQDAEIIAAQFGKKNAKSTKQITEILETLRGLGKL